MGEISIEENAKKGRVIYRRDGEILAEMTYTNAGESLVIIDHTEVSDLLQGQGVGKKLLYKMVDLARERDFQIIPLCPFAAHVFKKDESIHDVLKK